MCSSPTFACIYFSELGRIAEIRFDKSRKANPSQDWKNARKKMKKITRLPTSVNNHIFQKNSIYSERLTYIDIDLFDCNRNCLKENFKRNIPKIHALQLKEIFIPSHINPTKR